MSDHQAARREEYYKAPFNPAANLSPELRAANALEYIAANVGMIARAVERLEQGKLDAGSIVEAIQQVNQEKVPVVGDLVRGAMSGFPR